MSNILKTTPSITRITGCNVQAAAATLRQFYWCRSDNVTVTVTRKRSAKAEFEFFQGHLSQILLKLKIGS